MYQFHENEFSGGNAYTKNSVSTVLLCSAAESLLGIENNSKKRTISTMVAALLFPKGGREYTETYDLLENAYSLRNAFVHAGKVDYIDNRKLFFHVFSAWLQVAHLSLRHKEEKTLLDLIKKVIPTRSKIYRDIFFKDYLGT
jgi:hypothetical protein